MIRSIHKLLCGFGGACALLFCGCGGESPDSSSGAAPPPRTVNRGTGAGAATQQDRQAAMLNRVRQADPDSDMIERALFNDRNELGLILNRHVQMDDIPRLMKSLFPQMAEEFPGQDLTIVAYAPTQPPARLGVARFEARTRQMTYTSDQR